MASNVFFANSWVALTLPCQLIEIPSKVANRVQKVLETANIKLGDVATDVLGVSGRAMLKALVDGERDAHTLAALALGRLQEKRPALAEALNGHFTDHRAFLLRSLLGHLEFLEQQIGEFDRRIAENTAPMTTHLEHLDTIPGVARRSAERIIASWAMTATHATPCRAHPGTWVYEMTGFERAEHTSAESSAIWPLSDVLNRYAGRQNCGLSRWKHASY